MIHNTKHTSFTPTPFLMQSLVTAEKKSRKIQIRKNMLKVPNVVKHEKQKNKKIYLEHLYLLNQDIIKKQNKTSETI